MRKWSSLSASVARNRTSGVSTSKSGFWFELIKNTAPRFIIYSFSMKLFNFKTHFSHLYWIYLIQNSEKADSTMGANRMQMRKGFVLYFWIAFWVDSKCKDTCNIAMRVYTAMKHEALMKIGFRRARNTIMEIVCWAEAVVEYLNVLTICSGCIYIYWEIS